MFDLDGNALREKVQPMRYKSLLRKHVSCIWAVTRYV